MPSWNDIAVLAGVFIITLKAVLELVKDTPESPGALLLFLTFLNGILQVNLVDILQFILNNGVLLTPCSLLTAAPHPVVPSVTPLAGYVPEAAAYGADKALPSSWSDNWPTEFSDMDNWPPVLHYVPSHVPSNGALPVYAS